MKDLFTGYSKNIRPVVHPEDKVQVQIKMTLTNLISLVRAQLVQRLAGTAPNSKYTHF